MELFAKADVRITRSADGTMVLESAQPLGAYPRTINAHFVHWAQTTPHRPFLLERAKDKTWSRLTYAEALARVQRIAAALLERGIQSSGPIAILCDNSIDHALLMLAGMHVGIAVASISSAYSMMSSDFGKLKSIILRLSPRLIFVDDLTRYQPALRAIEGLHNAQIVIGNTDCPPEARVTRLLDFAQTDDSAVQHAFERVGPDTIAKVLFTSGSTDEPKGVINTQRMLCSSQQAKAQVWPFLGLEPPVLVDWLPWNHTFGGNHNFNLVVRNGGTLYIDGGKPVPALFGKTVENLAEVAPTIYFNVPKGFELLVEALRAQPALRARFFSRLRLIYYAGASLPTHLWDAMLELSVQTNGREVPLVSGWGSTETAPLATDSYDQARGPGVIGLPVPGCQLKLIPNADKMEVRVRGPNVFPGYWGRPDLTAKHFDAGKFYCIGDAVRFVDAAAPHRGILFDGRVAEDFKLTTGTWVSSGNLRMRAIAALAPVAQDVVVAGHDRADVRLLIFPNIPACRAMCPDMSDATPIAEMLANERVRDHIASALQTLARDFPGSSTHATAALLLTEPPSIDAGEITDKGYINQRAVLARRKDRVAQLYGAGHDSVIKLPR